MKKTETSDFFYGHIIVFANFLIMMVMWGTYYTFGIFLTPITAELGWARAATSLAFSISTLLRGPLSLIAGILTDKVGPRLVVTTCGLFLGVGYIYMARINTIWQLQIVYGVLIGIGMGASYTPFLSTTARWFAKRRGLVSGIVVSGGGLGILLAPLLADWLISSYGWRTAYLVIGALALFIILTAAQFLKRDPSQIGKLPFGLDQPKTESAHVEAQDITLREAIRMKPLWILCAAVLLIGLCLKVILVHLAPHVINIGYAEATAASIVSTIGGVSIIGRIGIGLAADKIGNKWAMTTSFFLFSVAFVFLSWAKELQMLYLFASLFGLAMGGFYAAFSPIVAQLFGIGSHGAVFGMGNFWHEIGGAMGPVLGGMLFDIYGDYGTAFIICSGLSIIATVLMFLVRQKRRSLELSP